MAHGRWLGLGLGWLLLNGCAAGAASEAVRTEAPSASQALGESACRDVKQGGEPLIVDWKPDQRGDLEVAMKDGVAIVSYSCEGIKLLADCKLDGDYGFIGTTRREQVVRLQNADELRANLPLSGISISSELERGTAIDIAMLTVGKKRTTWSTPARAELKGNCDGATHFVRGAIVGAFAMSTGSQAKVRAAAEIFGAGAEAASSSAKQTQNRDGDVADCQKASPDSDKPPPQCGAPIRLVLAPISDGAATTAAPAPGKEDEPVELSETNHCPDGMVFADGKCTEKAGASSYECAPSDPADCRAQCDKGNGASCGVLGEQQAEARAYTQAAELLKKGCDGGHARSCANYGRMLVSGLGVPQDVAAAVPLFDKSCQAADAVGCRELGRTYLLGTSRVPKDEARAAALFQKSCDGGDQQSCALLANLVGAGKGVPRDPARAAQLYKRACDGGLPEACAGAAHLYEVGTGVGKNEILARILYQRGCMRLNGASCLGLGRLDYARDPKQAKRHFEQACMAREQLGCAALKVLYGDARPVIPAIELTNQLGAACRAGSAYECASSALLDLTRGQTAPAKMNLQTACTRGDAFACAVLKKL
jgi:hypothetical protein